MDQGIGRESQTSILVVDDQLIQRALVVAQLEALGYIEILTAADPEEALLTVQHRPFSLCITDNRMPEPGDGIRLIKQYPNAFKTPFIIRSADLQEVAGDIARLRDNGLVIGILPKPNTISGLKRVIDEVTGLAERL